jgi:modification target Cys-rich repeat protein
MTVKTKKSKSKLLLDTATNFNPTFEPCFSNNERNGVFPCESMCESTCESACEDPTRH